MVLAKCDLELRVKHKCGMFEQTLFKKRVTGPGAKIQKNDHDVSVPDDRVRGDRGSRSCVRRQQWDTGDTQKRTDLGDAERDGDRMSQGTAVRSKTRHPLHPSTSRRESTTG